MSGSRIGFAILAFGIAAGSPPQDGSSVNARDSAAGLAAAEAEVRLALQAEAEGKDAERLQHLRNALAADPSHPAALGLMGLVTSAGQNVHPDDVVEKAKADAVMAEVLAEYNRRRALTGETVDEQWALALWCERTGLRAEAIAHYTAVTRLDPSHEAAWNRLGYRSHDGRWMTDAQIRAERAERAAQAAADREWRPRLVAWRAGLSSSDSERETAKAALNGIRDPRAVPTVWRLLASGKAVDQAWAVRILGHIDAPEAAHGLATLSVDAASPLVRNAAIDRLKRFDPGIFVGLLINRLRDVSPVHVVPVGGPGEPGELWISGAEVNLQWLYVVETSNAAPRRERTTPSARISLLRAPQRGLATPRRGEDSPDETGVADAVAEAQQQLDRDAGNIERTNREIQDANERAVKVLRSVTQVNLGPDREKWTQWWTKQLGYTYQSPKPAPDPKPTETRIASTVTARPAPPPVPVFAPPVGHHSCFAAGTLVHSKLGPQAIETVKVGDQVLSQDTATGALSYQPVIAVFHNPPSATVRVGFGEDEIVATGIHRFWQIGHGWTMARDLKPGDAVRALGGVRKVVSVSQERVQPVFNLEVATNQDYFVGKASVLVHDHSLVRPTLQPFDSARRQAPAAMASARVGR